MSAATQDPPADPALDGEHDDAELMEETFIGSTNQVTLNIGGPLKPDASTMKQTGQGEFPVDGEYKVGDKVFTFVSSTVEAVTGHGHRDRTEDQFTSMTRKHSAHVDRTRYVDPADAAAFAAILDDEALAEEVRNLVAARAAE
jgi:hypothetical protein